MGLWTRWIGRKVKRIDEKRWGWIRHKMDPDEIPIEHVGARWFFSDGQAAGIAYVTDRAFLLYEVHPPRMSIRWPFLEIKGLLNHGGGRFKLVWRTDRADVPEDTREGALEIQLYDKAPAAPRLFNALVAGCEHAHRQVGEEWDWLPWTPP